MSDKLLKADDVADMLKVSRRTVYDLTAEGILPSIVLRPSRRGRPLRRWSRRAVDHFIKEATQVSLK